MNKKGLNDIITTVLIILLSISAIVIVWGFVKSSLDDAEEKVSTGSVVLSPLKLESVKVNSDPTKIDVVIERTNNNPELEVSGAILIFMDVNGNTGNVEIDEQTIVKNLFEREASTLSHSLPPSFDFKNFQVVIRAKTKDKSGEDIILSSSSKKVYSDGVQVVVPGGGDECVPTAEICDQTDNDCDDLVDECEKQLGVCAGSTFSSFCTAGQTSCSNLDYVIYNSNYMATEAGLCSDGFDNDCDGATDDLDIQDCVCPFVADPCSNPGQEECVDSSTIKTCG